MSDNRIKPMKAIFKKRDLKGFVEILMEFDDALPLYDGAIALYKVFAQRGKPDAVAVGFSVKEFCLVDSGYYLMKEEPVQGYSNALALYQNKIKELNNSEVK